MNDYIIREFNNRDSIYDITQLLHRAYAVHLKKGLNFLAATQNENITEQRIKTGKTYIALNGSKIIGTITVYSPLQESNVPIYCNPDAFHFAQFAVDPLYQGKSIGKKLLNVVENYCRIKKAKILALDTSIKASKLILMYLNWGFELIDITQWENTNYKTVIMSKKL